MSEMARVKGFPEEQGWGVGQGGMIRASAVTQSGSSEWSPGQARHILSKPGISSSSHNDTAPIESGQFTGMEGLAGSQADLQDIHALWIW